MKYLHINDSLRTETTATTDANQSELKRIVMNRLPPQNAQTRIDIIAYEAG